MFPFAKTDSYNYKDDHNDRYYGLDSATSQLLASDGEIPILPLSDSDDENHDNSGLKSVIAEIKNPVSNNTTCIDIPPVPGHNAEAGGSNSATIPIPGTSTELSMLPADILDALGDPKGKEEVFGPNIPEEIAKRWGRVLLDGLTKEQKQQMTEKYLIPDNFRLAKAPLLNPEITPILNEAARNRDRLMEKSQNQLGLGISELTNLASTVIREDLSKVEILKRISEISQIFLDLHYEDTKRRRKLITASLDKKFIHMVSDVKRDTYLFGSNLGEKIKASKTAEHSGLQIKRKDPTPSSRKYPQQGNWRGPPRTQGQRVHRQGGPKARYLPQPNRRPQPISDRPPRVANKPSAKTQKP